MAQKIQSWILMSFLFLSTLGLVSPTHAVWTQGEFLDKISQLSQDITQLESDSLSQLESQVYNLNSEYTALLGDAGYDTRVVGYLVSLGKLTFDFQSELLQNVNELSGTITNNTSQWLRSLNEIKNAINLNYSSLSASQKIAYESAFDNINTQYLNAKQTYPSNVTQLLNHASNNLSQLKNSLPNLYNSHIETLNTLLNFEKAFDKLYELHNTLVDKYDIFTKNYLAFAGDLTLFSEEKQTHYIEKLSLSLYEIKDKNLDANASLKVYENEINRFIDILVIDFKNTLISHIDKSYGALYSENDIQSLLSSYTNLKNKYYDINSTLKANIVLSNPAAQSEVQVLYNKLEKIEGQITLLLGTGSSSGITYENIKIRLENEMITLYNGAYVKGYDDLMAKLQEKLNLATLEAKNIIIAIDAIDLRLSILMDKLDDTQTPNAMRIHISNFKKDMGKYTLLESDILNNKIERIMVDLELLLIGRQLTQSKYQNYSLKNYESMLEAAMEKLKKRYPDTYSQKVFDVIPAIDQLVSSGKYSTKNSYLFLAIKYYMLKAI